jgi:hypothetical protein
VFDVKKSFVPGMLFVKMRQRAMKYWDKDSALFRGEKWPTEVYHGGNGWVKYAGDPGRVVEDGMIIPVDEAQKLMQEIESHRSVA